MTPLRLPLLQVVSDLEKSKGQALVSKAKPEPAPGGLPGSGPGTAGPGGEADSWEAGSGTSAAAAGMQGLPQGGGGLRD